MNYLLKVTNVYRVPTVEAALKLRSELSETGPGKLTAFTYTHKEIKQKGEVIETYIVCKATLDFNAEKDPESHITVSYEE